MSDRDQRQADEIHRRAAVVLAAIEKAPDEAARLTILVDFYRDGGRAMMDEILCRMKAASGTAEVPR